MMQSYCKNCGHSTHCNTPLYRDEKDYDNRIYPIKVCDNCQCDNCQPKEE